MAKLKCNESKLELKPEPKFGDIVKCEFGWRVLLYDKYGKLRACYPSPNGRIYADSTSLRFCEPIGKNIFKDNLLNLNC